MNIRISHLFKKISYYIIILFIYILILLLLIQSLIVAKIVTIIKLFHVLLAFLVLSIASLVYKWLITY